MVTKRADRCRFLWREGEFSWCMSLKVKVKHNLDPHEANYLHTTVVFENVDNSKKLLTRVYFKPTDTHAGLHQTSSRSHRTASRETDLHNSILFCSLRQTGYINHLYAPTISICPYKTNWRLSFKGLWLIMKACVNIELFQPSGKIKCKRCTGQQPPSADRKLQQTGAVTELPV